MDRFRDPSTKRLVKKLDSLVFFGYIIKPAIDLVGKKCRCTCPVSIDVDDEEALGRHSCCVRGSAVSVRRMASAMS